MALTATLARTNYDAFKRETTDVDATTFYYWCDYVNKEFYRMLIGTDPERVITSTTYSVSTSPSTQALPAGFRDMATMGTGLYVRDSSGADTTEQLVRTGFGSTEKGYYLSGSNIVFTGINSSLTIVLRYIPAVTTISTGAGEFSIPDEYTPYVVNALDILYSRWNDETDGEANADSRWIRLMEECFSSIRRDANIFLLTPM